MMSNTEIRRFVHEKIRGNYWKILGFSFLVGLIKSIVSSILSFDNVIVDLILTILITAAATPLTVGFYRILVDILENKPTKTNTLFTYFNNFFNLFALGLVANLIIKIGDIINLFNTADLGIVSNILAIISLIAIIFGIVVEIIYTGILYLYVINPNMNIKSLVNTGREKMKGHTFNAFALLLSYLWPILLMIVIGIALVAIFTTSFILSIDIYDASILENFLEVSPGMIIFFAIYIVILAIIAFFIAPRLSFAQAVFYSQVMGLKLSNGNQVNNSMPMMETNSQNSMVYNPMNASQTYPDQMNYNQMNTNQVPNQTNYNQPNADTLNYSQTPAEPVNYNYPNAESLNYNQPAQTYNQTPSNPTMTTKFCPNCGSEVNGNFCPNCGNKL